MHETSLPQNLAESFPFSQANARLFKGGRYGSSPEEAALERALQAVALPPKPGEHI